ncbi:MAG: PhoU domain-containing protein [Bdellovibrionales bacterium]
MSVEYLQSRDQEVFDKIMKYEDISDNIRSEIEEFSGQVVLAHLSETQGRQILAMIRMSAQLEGIADRCKSIVMDQKQILSMGMTLEGPWYDELKKMLGLTLEVFESAFWQIAETGEQTPMDFRAAKLAKFDSKFLDLRKSYTQWLRSEAASQYEWEAGVRFGDIVNSLMYIRKVTTNLFEVYNNEFKR